MGNISKFLITTRMLALKDNRTKRPINIGNYVGSLELKTLEKISKSRYDTVDRLKMAVTILICCDTLTTTTLRSIANIIEQGIIAANKTAMFWMYVNVQDISTLYLPLFTTWFNLLRSNVNTQPVLVNVVNTSAINCILKLMK